MADTTVLLNGLKSYRDSLEKHLQELQVNFDQLEHRWKAFSRVYEGNAAKQFKSGWRRTENNFEDYLENSRRILGVLNERIVHLEEADRIEDM